MNYPKAAYFFPWGREVEPEREKKRKRTGSQRKKEEKPRRSGMRGAKFPGS